MARPDEVLGDGGMTGAAHDQGERPERRDGALDVREVVLATALGEAAQLRDGRVGTTAKVAQGHHDDVLVSWGNSVASAGTAPSSG